VHNHEIYLRPKFVYASSGLDSGALDDAGRESPIPFKRLASTEAAVYRGQGKKTVGVFYLNVDKSSPVAQATIDLSCFESKNRFAGRR